MCGHRYSSQVLPEWMDEEYLAWSVAKRDVRTKEWIMENYTVFQLMEAFAFSRTDKYLDEEPTEEK